MSPGKDVVLLRFYDGLLKVIPLNADGTMRDAYDMRSVCPSFSRVLGTAGVLDGLPVPAPRLDELQTLSMVFLKDAPLPTLAVLYEVRAGWALAGGGVPPRPTGTRLRLCGGGPRTAGTAT